MIFSLSIRKRCGAFMISWVSKSRLVFRSNESFIQPKNVRYCRVFKPVSVKNCAESSFRISKTSKH